jgi:hypothetical protein
VSVVVEVAGERFDLRAGDQFTFGRDPSVCTVCLGFEPLDQGISRLAGAIAYDNGLWWISNRSTTRSLHVIDVETGIGVPLPVARENWPAPRHPVDRPRLTVLVVGQVLTHAITVAASPRALPTAETPPKVVDTVRTTNLLPRLTDKQRDALVAMVEGYLLRFPHYYPEPRTYEEAADRLGLPSSTVRRRIEYVRDQLVTAGVPGLQGGDARRNLAEWLLSNRFITPTDLDRLDRRRGRGDR